METEAEAVPLIDDIEAFVNANPTEVFTMHDIRVRFGDRAIKLGWLYDCMGKLVQRKRIWRVRRGVYRARGARAKSQQADSIATDCARVLGFKRMREYAETQKGRLKCCKACHQGDGQKSPGTVLEQGYELCCRMAVHFARASGEEFVGMRVLTDRNWHRKDRRKRGRKATAG